MTPHFSEITTVLRRLHATTSKQLEVLNSIQERDDAVAVFIQRNLWLSLDVMDPCIKKNCKEKWNCGPNRGGKEKWNCGPNGRGQNSIA
jgi:hypothetical protein